MAALTDVLDQDARTALRTRIQAAYSAWLERRGARARGAQKHMVADIYRTLTRSAEEGPPIAVIEAGTGTGKTLAYGLAAIPVAQASHRVLVVSTATVALQEQLVARDLPELQQHLDFSFALAKGRQRYVCVQRLDQSMQSGSQAGLGFEMPLDLGAIAEGVRPETAGALLDALSSRRWNGEQETLPISVDDREWRQLTVDGSVCAGARCDFFQQCPFFQARAELEQRDVIVANHDLVLTHLLTGQSSALPEPEDALYVFDEAHHLPAKLQQHARASGRVGSLGQLCESYGGLLERLAAEPALTAGVGSRTAAVLAAAQDTAAGALPVADALHGCWSADTDDDVHRFPHGIVPPEFGAAAGALETALTGFRRLHTDLADWVEKTLEDEGVLPEAPLQQARDALRMLTDRLDRELETWRDFAAAAHPSDVPRARWLRRNEFESHGEATTVPLVVGPLLDELLWARCAGAVLTSATLTAAPDFARLRETAGLPTDAHFAIYPGSFDYAASTLTVHEDLLPGSEQLRFDEAMSARLPGLLDGEAGTLILCTSRRQLRTVRQQLMDAPELGRLGGADALLVQDEISKAELLARHVERIDAGATSIILGLQSFAEGIDLPGRYCGHLIICKIPFAPPDDPVGAAETERIEAAGGDAFAQITLPEATLRLKQWVGRLVRTETDVGRVTVLDGRLVRRAYGRRILAALPPFTVRTVNGA